jgi:hypothetical protein
MGRESSEEVSIEKVGHSAPDFLAGGANFLTEDARAQPRNSRGVIPVQRLNARSKVLRSE